MNPLRVFLTGILLAPAALAWAQNPFDVPPRPKGPFEIRGVVVDAKTGQPLPEVNLSIQDSAQPSNPAFEIIQSQSDGSFRISNLPEGKYTIRAARQGYAQQAFLQHENFWTGIAVGSGKDSLRVRFALNPSATITGQVTDENAEPVRGAEITVWVEAIDNGSRGISQAQSTQTDDEGRYRVGHLLAGRYSVSVQAVPWYSRYKRGGDQPENAPTNSGASMPDLVYPSLYYPNVRDWHGMEWMNLQSGQVESADFHLLPEPSVHLQVHVHAGENGQQPNVALMSDLPGGGQANVVPGAITFDSGIMEISGVAAGRYRLVQAGGREESEEALDLSGNSQFHLDDATPAGGPTIRGVIRSVESEADLEHALIQLRDAKGRTYNNLFIDNSGNGGNPPGTFVMENMPTGPQVLELDILQPVDAVVKKIEAKGAKITGTTIETDGDQQVSLIVTVGRNSNAITGTAFKDGKPFAGAMILLMPEDRKDWERRVRRDQSDSDGTFRLGTVLPGKYSLLAMENGWGMEWSKPEVLQPFLVKAQKLEVGEGQINPATVEVQ